MGSWMSRNGSVCVTVQRQRRYVYTDCAVLSRRNTICANRKKVSRLFFPAMAKMILPSVFIGRRYWVLFCVLPVPWALPISSIRSFKSQPCALGAGFLRCPLGLALFAATLGILRQYWSRKQSRRRPNN